MKFSKIFVALFSILLIISVLSFSCFADTDESHYQELSLSDLYSSSAFTSLDSSYTAIVKGNLEDSKYFVQSSGDYFNIFVPLVDCVGRTITSYVKTTGSPPFKVNLLKINMIILMIIFG